MNPSKAEQILETIDAPRIRRRQPILIATFGLPGAGKTSVSAIVERNYPVVVLSTDALRLKFEFPDGPATLEAMREVAKQLLSDKQSVLFDGIHMMRKNRNELRAFGVSCNAHVRFIYVRADAATIKARLDERLKRPDETTRDGKFVVTAEHFARIAQYLEIPVGETDVTQVNTALADTSVDIQLQPLFDELATLL